MAQGIFGRSKKGAQCAEWLATRLQDARKRHETHRTLWMALARPTEAQGARGEVLRGRCARAEGVFPESDTGCNRYTGLHSGL
jgi:hypothetical protein